MVNVTTVKWQTAVKHANPPPWSQFSTENINARQCNAKKCKAIEKQVMFLFCFEAVEPLEESQLSLNPNLKPVARKQYQQ